LWRTNGSLVFARLRFKTHQTLTVLGDEPAQALAIRALHPLERETHRVELAGRQTELSHESWFGHNHFATTTCVHRAQGPAKHLPIGVERFRLLRLEAQTRLIRSHGVFFAHVTARRARLRAPRRP